ncbi:DUF421 domain-containing protein [Cribrihabitans sp. XS_ASV171]
MEQAQTWVSEPYRLTQVVLSAAVFFVFIVALMRLSGKRTTASMNNFDWIITVGIGSLMATGILSRKVAMLDAMAAIAALAAMQWVTTWGVLKSKRFAKMVKPKPRLLMHDGAMLKDAMEAERVSADELKSALREAGIARREDADWIVIETSGVLSVMPRKEMGLGEAELLDGVAVPEGVGGGTRDDRGGPEPEDEQPRGGRSDGSGGQSGSESR